MREPSDVTDKEVEGWSRVGTFPPIVRDGERVRIILPGLPPIEEPVRAEP